MERITHLVIHIGKVEIKLPMPAKPHEAIGVELKHARIIRDAMKDAGFDAAVLTETVYETGDE